jgi:feruloyl esterase
MSEQNMRFLGTDNDDPALTWQTFRFPQDLDRLKTMTEILSPLDPDIRPFKANGGKLLMYHGWADPAISAYGTVSYFEKATQAVGGGPQMDTFARLYMVPGMHHCSGGPGPNQFDMLTPLENWVEKGIAPAAITARSRIEGRLDRTRPLCPYPQVAEYTGSGSIEEAANFRCVAPRAQ